MSEQERCKYRAYCVQDCPAKLAHGDGDCVVGMWPGCPYPLHPRRVGGAAYCVPVEQPAPEPPTPDLDVDRIVANYSNPTMCIVKADITALAAEIERLRNETVPSLERDNTVLRTMLREAQDPSIAAQEEIERLRGMLVKRFRQLRASQERLRQHRHETHDEIEQLEQERDELKTRREYALSALGEMTIAFAELQAELDALNSAGIAGWLVNIVGDKGSKLKRQCSAAMECTALECKLMYEHSQNGHANCGAVHYCHYCEDEEVRCEAVTK